MNRFSVTVRTELRVFSYVAIATTAAGAAMDAYDEFGPCGVSVRSLA